MISDSKQQQFLTFNFIGPTFVNVTGVFHKPYSITVLARRSAKNILCFPHYLHISGHFHLNLLAVSSILCFSGTEPFGIRFIGHGPY